MIMEMLQFFFLIIYFCFYFVMRDYRQVYFNTDYTFVNSIHLEKKYCILQGYNHVWDEDIV